MDIKIVVLAFALTVACASPMPKSSNQEIPMTQETVDRLNSIESGFKARLYPEIAGKSVDELRRMTGISMKPSKYFRNARFVEPNQKLIDEPPFEAADHWPQCAVSINDIPAIGHCDGSWAFSVAGAITDRLCIKKNYQTLPISAYDLMSCCGDCWLDGVNGCNGGDHDSASQYYITNGIVTGGEFRSHIGCKPYPIRPNEDAPEPPKTVCRASCENGYNVTYENDKHYGFNQTVFTLRNLDVMNEIKKNGPVVAEFEFYQDFLFYTGGIYKHLNGTLLGYRYAKIIGWGDDDKGTGYWRAVGFRGQNWGSNGTFLVARGENEIGFESSIIGVTVLN